MMVDMHTYFNSNPKTTDMKTREFSSIVWKEDTWYVSLCPELDIASQGKTIEKALENLKEAVELYLEDEDVQKMIKVEHKGKPVMTTIKVAVGS